MSRDSSESLSIVTHFVRQACRTACFATGVAVLLILPEVVSSVASELTDGPKAVVSGTVADVGKLPRGKTVTSKFKIENTGTTPLEVEARANCGCTVADYDRIIAPGGTGNFTVELKTATLLGEFRKTVDVRTNDSTLPKFSLEIRGDSVPAVEIVPDSNLPIELSWEGITEKEYRIETAAGVSLIDASSTDELIKAKLDRIETGAYRLILSVQPDIEAGTRNASVVLTSDAEFEKQIPLAIRAEKGLISTPPALKLPRVSGQASKPVKSAVLVRSASGPVRIVRSFSSDESLKVETKEIKEGKIFQVIVERTGTTTAKSPQTKRTVTLETDDPRQPRFEIPIR
jgi:hypothetical protein